MDDGARTHDRWNHNPELYQLSYVHHIPCRLARPTGLEPATAGLEGRCSIRLSYRRIPVDRRRHGRVERSGRGRGIRTPDILLPKQVRYQTALYPACSCLCAASNVLKIERILSPTPSKVNRERLPVAWPRDERGPVQRGDFSIPERKKGAEAPSMELARPERFELPTTKFVAWYSIQLSYGRIKQAIMRDACEPVNAASATPGQEKRACGPFSKHWRRGRDSNPRSGF